MTFYLVVKVKAKFSLQQAKKADVQLYFGNRHVLPPYPQGKTRYPLYRRLGGPQGQSGRVQKIWLPPGFDPWTVQPIASRYTDWAIPAPGNTLAFNYAKVVYVCLLHVCLIKYDTNQVLCREFPRVTPVLRQDYDKSINTASSFAFMLLPGF